MKSNSLLFRRFVYFIFFVILCSLVSSSTVGVAFGQKKPGSLNQGTTSDDKGLCAEGNNSTSEFCVLYSTYSTKKVSDPAAAKKARNEMIDLVQWQIEIYYKARKDNRKKLVQMLQMIFDVLEIGTAAATGIVKGTLRAKSIMAQALSGFQAGRTAANRNFDILQTQVLINTMNTNRAEIATSIESSKNLDVDNYTWYAAKRDLTRLLNAGTFSDALDTLVKTTGEDAAKAEAELIQAKRNAGITLAPTAAQYKASMDAAAVIDGIIDGWEIADNKVTTATQQITAADAAILAENQKNPPAADKDAKIATAKQIKAQAQLDITTAETTKKNALVRMKKIYGEIIKDAELKPLLSKIIPKFPEFKDDLEPMFARIDADTATFEDYAQIIPMFNRIAVDEMATKPSIMEKIINILEASK